MCAFPEYAVALQSAGGRSAPQKNAKEAGGSQGAGKGKQQQPKSSGPGKANQKSQGQKGQMRQEAQQSPAPADAPVEVVAPSAEGEAKGDGVDAVDVCAFRVFRCAYSRLFLLPVDVASCSMGTLQPLYIYVCV